jgi:DNA-binding NtrC family response regulator
MSGKILLVDDDLLILKIIKANLIEQGYEVIAASSGEEAITILQQESVPFDLVLTDLVMAGADGISVLKKAKEVDPDVAVLILTGHGDLESAISALRLKADDYLLKPCEPEVLTFRIEKCMERRLLTRKVKLYEKILPACCVCGKVRDDTGVAPGEGAWMPFDVYVMKRAGVAVSHAYCPECARRVMEKRH